MRGEPGPELFIPATGGHVTGPVYVAGESGCDLAHRCECSGPANITINIHGTVLNETGLADVVRKQVLRYRQGGNGLSSA